MICSMQKVPQLNKHMVPPFMDWNNHARSRPGAHLMQQQEIKLNRSKHMLQCWYDFVLVLLLMQVQMF